MKISTFLSVNNENLGVIARMSNGTYICIVYKGVQVAPKQGFQKYVWVTIVLRSTLDMLPVLFRNTGRAALGCEVWSGFLRLR